jgi:hypothetical protein
METSTEATTDAKASDVKPSEVTANEANKVAEEPPKADNASPKKPTDSATPDKGVAMEKPADKPADKAAPAPAPAPAPGPAPALPTADSQPTDKPPPVTKTPPPPTKAPPKNDDYE